MLAAMACVPLEAVGFWAQPFPWIGRFAAIIFATAIGIHYSWRHRQGRSVGIVALTGAWVLPITVTSLSFVDEHPAVRSFGDFCFAGISFSLVGLLAGIITVKQFEAAIVLWSLARRRMAAKASRRAPPQPIHERIDEASAPLEAPPAYGIPRRFGIRGLLIVTTWAAVPLGFLRARGADPAVYFMVMPFLAGTLAAQVLLFQGRSPIKASAWAGAFLLPVQILAINLYNDPLFVSAQPGETVLALVAGFACSVPAGIALGVVAGAVGGWLYYIGEEFFLWLTRGLPKIALEPVTDDDAEVLLSWITGPKFCQRWAGDRFAWPLDRQQLLERFGVVRDRTVRKIYKAVDLRNDKMVGYVELGRIDYTLRRAWVELPLVDPDASERGRIGVRMLYALAEYAFSTLGLFSIIIIADSDQSELALCCQKACQASFEHYALADNRDARWIATVRRFTPLA
jgi:RimJ/RimL family protein N-acetyltransferase